MILIAFLGPRLGSPTRTLLRHKQMPRSVGEGQIRKRAGTTPPLAARAAWARWSFPPFGRVVWSRTRLPADQRSISN